MGAPDISETRRLIDFAAKAAETFVSAYYAATDAPHRVQLIPTLYLPDATIVWNGHPISGSSNLAALLNSMPGSKHEVQTFDCHPLGGGTVEGFALSRLGSRPGTQGKAIDGLDLLHLQRMLTGTFQTPSLTLTVSGVVVHHTPGSLSAMPQSNAPNSSSGSGKSRGHPSDGSDSSIPIDSLARAFSQNFVLVPQAGQETGGINVSATQEGKTISGRFFVQADAFRFIG